MNERQKRDRLLRRRQIQAAAARAFAERGYAKTTIEHVAREASLSVGGIYLHFRSKEDLYASLLEGALERLDAELAAQSYPGPSMVWARLVEWAAADPEGPRALRMLALPDARAQLADEVVAALVKGLEQLRHHIAFAMSSAIAGGLYRAADPEELADLLWSLFLGLVETVDARRTLGMGGASLDERAAATFRAFEGLLLVAAPPRPAV